MTSFLKRFQDVDDPTKMVVNGWIREKLKQIKVQMNVPLIISSVSIIYLYQPAIWNMKHDNCWKFSYSDDELLRYIFKSPQTATMRYNIHPASSQESFLYDSNWFAPYKENFEAIWTIRFDQLEVCTI